LHAGKKTHHHGFHPIVTLKRLVAAKKVLSGEDEEDPAASSTTLTTVPSSCGVHSAKTPLTRSKTDSKLLKEDQHHRSKGSALSSNESVCCRLQIASFRVVFTEHFR